MDKIEEERKERIFNLSLGIYKSNEEIKKYSTKVKNCSEGTSWIYNHILRPIELKILGGDIRWYYENSIKIFTEDQDKHIKELKEILSNYPDVWWIDAYCIKYFRRFNPNRPYFFVERETERVKKILIECGGDVEWVD